MTVAKRILVVEDDPSICRVLRDNLEFEGFLVESAETGEEALICTRAFFPDLVLLDIMLPGIDGFQVCQALSNETSRTPVIILTARTQKDDKVRGLELGADDYVTKPFALDELLARVHAVLRRSHSAQDRLVAGDLVVDFRMMHARRGERDLALTPKEFQLLECLFDHAGRVVSRDELLHLVWHYDEMPITRTVDNFIARLRRKIELNSHHPQLIRTVHGDGYSLTLVS